jgi:hypothetical protein
MGICDEQPQIKRELLLMIQAQMVEGYGFVIPDSDMETPEPTTDVYRILDAICNDEPIFLLKPLSSVREPTDESD